LKKGNYYILAAKISGYLLVPLILLLLPANFFDKGQSLCLSKLLAGVECYGCGMTRAIMHLIHFDFKGAYEFNKLAFISFPVLSFLWLQGFRKDFNQFKGYKNQKDQISAG
jgi:hypothetical protein